MSPRRTHISMVAVLFVACAALAAHYSFSQSSDEAAVRDALMKSASSFEKNDMAAATQVWANDESLTVFESGHANYGWADNRDHHLGPEMKEMQNTKYAFSDIKIRVSGNTAWATMKYSIAADVGEAGKTGTLKVLGWPRRSGRSARVNGASSIGIPAPLGEHPLLRPARRRDSEANYILVSWLGKCWLRRFDCRKS